MITPDAFYKDVERLVQTLRGDLFQRFMRRAQKQALLEWRDRKTAPGLAARFTQAGARFYGFGQRGHYYGRTKSPHGYAALPDYVKTGRTRDLQATRKPVARRAGDQVVTVLRFGGGALTQLTDIGPVLSEERTSTRIQVPVAGYTYKHHRSGRSISVPGYVGTRKRTQWVTTRSSTSYAAEFGRFERDRPWIAERTGVLFREIFRRAALTKRGELRSALFEEADKA